MKKVLIPTILFIIILTILASANTWVIEGDKVIFENQYGKIVVWPHTGQNLVTQTQYSNITSYFEQPINLDFAFRIPSNKAGMVNNKRIYIWKNTSHEVPTYGDKTFYLTCNYPDSSYNYTVNPNHAWCWNDTVTNNQTLIWGHWFDGGNINNKTVWWDQTVQTGTHEEYWFDWEDITSKFGHEELQGNDYYFIRNVTFQPNKTKSVKWSYDTPLNSKGKWEIFIKRTQDPLQDAISSGQHIIHLDPWWNSTWKKCRNITLDNTGNSNTLTNYQVKINLTNNTNFNNNWSDVRFVNTYCDNSGSELDHWVEAKSDGSYDTEWVEVDSIAGSANTTISVYYNNTQALNNSDGDATFDVWDDFAVDGLSADLYNKTGGNGTAYAVGGIAWTNSTATGDYAAIGENNSLTENFSAIIKWNLKDSNYGLGDMDYSLVNTSYPVAGWSDADMGIISLCEFAWRSNDNLWLICWNNADTIFWWNNATQSWSSTVFDTYSASLNTDYYFEFRRNQSHITLRLLDSNKQLLIEAPRARSDIRHENEPTYIVWGDLMNNYVYANLSVDDFIVRKYQTPEPAYSISDEESAIASEQEGRDAIEQGIRNSLGTIVPIYTDRQMYTRHLNNTQQLGRFDKVTVEGLQRWAFNYVTGNESFTNMLNMTPSLYILEMENKTANEITNEVEIYINQTNQ